MPIRRTKLAKVTDVLFHAVINYGQHCFRTLYFHGMTPQREAKIRQMLHNRQPNLGVVLENVKDQHNIYAVLRSCEAIGVGKVYIIHEMKNLEWYVGRASSGKSLKWIEYELYSDIDTCMAEVTSTYDQILTTHMHKSATPLHETDFTPSTALIFGNEKLGVSEEMMRYATGNFLIPMMGMTQSLNISVACAVTLYEAYRQKKQAGHYDQPGLTEQQINAFIEQYS